MKEYQYDAPGVLDKIVTPCTVDVQDYDTKSETNINSCSINALWDTGATVSVVSESLIHRLGLIPTDITKVSGWDGVPVSTNIYNIDLLLGDLRIDFVKVVRGPLVNTDMIIGMTHEPGKV